MPFLSDSGFWLLNSPGPSLTVFLFSDAPNVFFWLKVWTAVRPVQHLDSPCCRDGCSMCFSIVLLKYARSSLKETLSLMTLMGADVALKPQCALQLMVFTILC